MADYTLRWYIPGLGLDEELTGELTYKHRFGDKSPMRSRSFFCEHCGEVWGWMRVWVSAEKNSTPFIPEFKPCPRHGGRQLFPKEDQLLNNLSLVPRVVKLNLLRVALEVYARDPGNFTFSHVVNLNQKDLKVCLSQV